MIHWLIQQADLRDGDAVQRLSYAVEELGMTAHVVPYVPFGGMDYSFLPKDEPVFAYGSVSMIRDAQARCERAPVAYCDWSQLRCSTYYAHYGAHLLQSPYALLPLAEIRRLRTQLFLDLGEDHALFIRPDENDKSFDGQVVYATDFEHFYELAQRSGESPEVLCVVARPTRILQEWRVMIGAGEVVTGSQYRRRGSLELIGEVPDEVASYARLLASLWSPHPLFVMDIARTSEGLRLIEIGSVNCAGLYACDLRAFANAVKSVLSG